MQPASHRGSHTRPDSAQTRHTTSKATNSAPCTSIITTSALAQQSQHLGVDVSREVVRGALQRSAQHATALHYAGGDAPPVPTNVQRLSSLHSKAFDEHDVFTAVDAVVVNRR